MRRIKEISTAQKHHSSFNSFFHPSFTSEPRPLNPAPTNAHEPSVNDTTCCGATFDTTTTGFSLSKADDDDDENEASYNLAALCLFVIAVMAIGGNVLVCLAVCCKRKLQSMFNYFLVSLALSDMLSGALVMPLSIVRMTTLGKSRAYVSEIFMTLRDVSQRVTVFGVKFPLIN